MRQNGEKKTLEGGDQFNDLMILLHLDPTDLTLKPKESKFMNFAILQWKRNTGLNWKKIEAPKIFF